jgi:hypothetical protein
MISEEAVEAAVRFFEHHADDLGKLIGHCKGLEHQVKIVFGQALLEAKKNTPKATVPELEARARNSAEYKAIVEDVEDAWADRVTLETKLKAKELGIEVWRSQYSKQGKGHL